MNVLILNQYALPNGEAGITRHGDIGAELVKRGHRVVVIASDYDYLSRHSTRRRADGSTGKYAGVEFKWLSTGTYSANDRRRMLSMGRYAAAAAWTGLRMKFVPDVVIGSSPQPLAPLAALAIARYRRAPFVFEARDIWPSALVDLGAIKRDGFTHRVLVRLERFLFRHARAIVTVPPRGELRLAELGLDPAKATHIPNGASTDAGSDPLPGTLSTLLSSVEDRFRLVYAGAIGIPHDWDTVLATLTLLKSTRPEIYGRLALILVGDGVAAASTLARAKSLGLDNLHMHAPVPKRAVRSLLAAADACLMQAAASDHFRYGLSPNKLFDYFAAAKPVLIASAYPTIVDEANAGIRYQPGNAAAMADAVAAIMNAPESERNQMGLRGQRLVESEYSISAITDRYEALLHQAVTATKHR